MQRRTLVALLTALIVWPSATAARTLQRASSVVHHAGTAVHASSVANVPSFRLQEATTTWPAHAGLGGFAGYQGPVESVSTWWYASPKRWRISGRYLVSPRSPVLRGSELDGASFWPVPGTVVSDGQDIWRDDGRSVQVEKILPEDSISQFARYDAISPFGENTRSLHALLARARQSWRPRLTGSATIAGRPTYVIDLGPNLSSRGSYSSRLSSGRSVIWVDTQTFFVLQWKLYSPADPTKLLTQTRVTAVQYGAVIPARLLRFVPPAGSIVDDSRADANAAARPYRQALGRLAPRLSFPLLAPYDRPAGLSWSLPRSIPNGNVALAFVPPRSAPGRSVQDGGVAILERRATAADLSSSRRGTRVAAGGTAGWYRVIGKRRELSLVIDGTSISLVSGVLDRAALLELASIFARVPGGHAPIAVPGVVPLAAIRQVLAFPVFIPTWLPAGLTLRRVAEGAGDGGEPPISAEIEYSGPHRSLSVFEDWAGCCIDQDVRKWDAPIPLSSGGPAFSIVAGTVWFDRAGTFVGLSGSHLAQRQLIRIAGALSGNAPGHPGPRMTVTPARVLVDQAFVTRITGLSPGQDVTVNCQYVDALGVLRRSHATFRAGSRGTLDLATQAPVAGGYAGVDPMGLIWSVPSTATNNDLSDSALIGFSHPDTVTLTAVTRGHEIARATVTRYLLTPAVSHYSLQTEGLYGELYWPTGKVHVPGVLVLGGSEGGMSPLVIREAALLAAHGYAALALAYFGEGTLPVQLARIPLEYFMKALTWMQRQKQVDPGRLAVMGSSRGGELALLLAAHDPRLKAAISYVGSGIVFSSPDSPNQPAWIWHGRPIQWLRAPATQAQLDAAAIPVQQINGPMLLIAGKDDRIWSSSRQLQFALQWAHSHHHHFADQFLSYAGAGHLIEPPYLATSAFVDPHYGGDAKDQEHADAGSWSHILRLLSSRLRR